MYVWTDGLQNRWLDECLKIPVPKDPSRSDRVNELDDSTFTIFIDLCEQNSGWKGLSEWYGES